MNQDELKKVIAHFKRSYELNSVCNTSGDEYLKGYKDGSESEIEDVLDILGQYLDK